jgi:two-component system invasion response regulator UvrY
MDLPQSLSRLRVAIAERSAPMRRALVSMLGDRPEIELVGQAGDRGQLLALLRSHRPDVLILDPATLGPGGLQTLPMISGANADTAILVSDFAGWSGYEEAVRGLGAAGLIPKNAPPEVWLRAIRACA